MIFNEEEFQFEKKSSQSIAPNENPRLVQWINVDGLHDVEQIGAICQKFGIHVLVVEDILNTRHRPKVEEVDGLLFLSMKMLGVHKSGKTTLSEQVSLVLGPNWVISFQERQGDVFDVLRERLRESKGNLRKSGADYLFYRLIDTVVDHYFLVNDHLSERTELLEEKVLEMEEDSVLQEIQRLKKNILSVRKSVTPLREAVGSIQKDATLLVKDTTLRYFRDVYEHLIYVSESLETQREMLSSIMDLYQTNVSNKMNQVMQVLTIIATIFIPLTFIAGVYGMNFKNMPELEWQYGYFGVLAIMAALIGVMILYFKKKRWL
jgi:magnesium transporter